MTRNSPLIAAVSGKRPGKYLIRSGSFIGGGGCTEATVDEAAEYLARRPHLAHLMQLTLEMEWHDAPREIIKQLLPLHSPVISPSLSSVEVDPEGGPTILILACGHRVERANHFSYKVHDVEHCIQCKGRKR